MFTKVCGLTTTEHIDWAVELGYSAIGIVVYPKSPRFCDKQKAVTLAEYAKNKITSVVVSIDYSDVTAVSSYFDFVQIHEVKNIPNLIYAGTTPPANGNYQYFIYDASMGSGHFKKLPDWLAKNNQGNIIISGGLDQSNVKEVIATFSPFGIDVSSGVESTRGLKDYNKMKAFINEVHNAKN